MKISISKDIRPLTDLQKYTNEILSDLRKSKNPIIITKNGRSAAVIVNVKLFEELWEKAELLDEMVKGSCESFPSYYKLGKNKNWLTTYEFAKLKWLKSKTISTYVGQGKYFRARKNEKGFWEIHQSEL